MSIAPIRAGSPNTAQQTDRTSGQQKQVPLYMRYLKSMSEAYSQMVANFNARRKAYSAGKPTTTSPQKKPTPKTRTPVKPQIVLTKASNDAAKTEKKEASDDEKKAAEKEDGKSAEKTDTNKTPSKTKPKNSPKASATPVKNKKKEAAADEKKEAAKEDAKSAENTTTDKAPGTTTPQMVGTTEGSKADVKTDEEDSTQPLAEEPTTVC